MFRTILAAGITGLGVSINLDARTNNFLGNYQESDQQDQFDLNVDASAEVREILQGLATDLLAIHPVNGMASVQGGVQAVSGKMDIKTALKTISSQKKIAD
jgi:hypothetical protein